MKKFSILLDSVEKIKMFCEVTNTYELDVDLVDGMNMADGKSILGILSMNVNRPLKLKIHTNKEGEEEGLISTLMSKSFQISTIS